MKSKRKIPKSDNLLRGKWQEVRYIDYMNYCAVYEVLDELTLKNISPVQIEEHLKKLL